MAHVARHAPTYEDVLKVPHHLLVEIVEGELFTSPRPAMALCDALLNQLRDGAPGWRFEVQPVLRFGNDVLLPALAGWSARATAAPDWVCDIVNIAARYRKPRIYARHEVTHRWLIDPDAKLLEGYRRQEIGWLYVSWGASDDVLRAEPFESCDINLGALWID